MDNRLVSLEVENFRSLRKITLPLGPVTVLVGPNGAGKTNVLKVLEFLADIIRTDLEPALDGQGGFDEVVFDGGSITARHIRIKARLASAEYELRVVKSDDMRRFETFSFDDGRRVDVINQEAAVSNYDMGTSSIGISEHSSGLSTLPRLHGEAGIDDVGAIARQLSSLRVFDVSVEAARLPGRLSTRGLASDASNLAAYLFDLRRKHDSTWEQLVDDARFALPQLESIDFTQPAGDTREVSVVLRENGLRRPTPLRDASFGTVRMLGLLALLHDPNPPELTCVEEIENGLHPQALEMLVERIREASDRTQFLIATHSPALVDRLYPDEFVICERNEDGSSAIPAISTDKVREIVATSEDLPLGELWFSGVLGGDL
jgi:predicted ATPase